jgi:hypothetical protein
LAVARRAIPGGSVQITRRIVTRLGFSVAQPRGDVAILSGEPGLAAANSPQLVGPGIFAVLGGMCAILGGNPPIVDSLSAVVRSPSAPRGGPRPFVRRVLTVARRANPCGSVQVTGRIVTRLGFLVTEPGCNVTVLRRLPGLAAAHSRQLVGAGIFEVLGRLRSILGRHLAVVDCLGAVVGCLSVTRWTSGILTCRVLTLARCPIHRGSV